MSLHEKLVAIQSELKAPKGQMNNFGKYKYRSCEDILESLKPLLKEHGLSLTLSDEIVNIGTRFYVVAEAELSDGDSLPISVVAYAREEEEKKGMDGSQITGAASSYARKYALNGLFLIDDTKDSDATNTHDTKPKVAKTTVTVKASEPGTNTLKLEGGSVTVATPDNCTTEQMKQISDLCKETNTDQAQLYKYFSVGLVPTNEEAQRMIVTLKAKLAKQLDSLA
jgi:hypothetical protein